MKRSQIFFQSSAFTLIELIVVIAIIVILAASLGLGVLGVLARAENARAESNILAIESAIRQYLEDWKTLPFIDPIPGASAAAYTRADIENANKNLAILLESTGQVGITPIKWTVGPYITPNRGMKKDPTFGYYSDPWGYAYIIKFPGLDHTSEPIPGANNTSWIDIFSFGPNGVYDTLVDDDDDITNYRKTTK